MPITITDRGDARVQALRARIPPMTAAILFGGDRWLVVACVALALDDQDQPIGLATLAPTDELGGGGPHIIGVWVDLARRRQGVGQRLVQALIDESLTRYGAPPTAVAVTPAGLALVRRVQATDPRLIVVDVGALLAGIRLE